MTSENETRTVSGTTEGLAEAECAFDLQVGAPRGNRTPNPLILVRGFATILNNASTPALTSVYSSRGMNPAWRRFASLLVQRWGLKCGSRNLADTYVSRLLPPRRIAG
jgi:hypothetical protein